MLWVLQALDRPDSGEVRAANREEHLEWIAQWDHHVVRGGPFLTDDGKTMIGSLIVVDFDDRAAVETWAADDPYAKAGLFASVTITAWKKTIGAD